MAVNLSMLTKPERNRPIIATIFSEGGMGKTSLAASFPAPVIFRIEDGATAIRDRDGVLLTPLLKTTNEVFSWIEAMLNEEHGYKTAVFDSITQFRTMAEAEVLAADGSAKALAKALGGYGAGVDAVRERMRQLREWAGKLFELRGMNVLFLAHADVEDMEPPDAEPFKRYTIRIPSKQGLSNYTDNVDVVGYIKLKTMVNTVEGEHNRASTTGERVLVTYATPANVSKNRFGIMKDLPFKPGTNPLEPYLAPVEQAAPQDAPAQQAA